MSNLRKKILSLEPNSNTSNQTALVDGIYITSQTARKQALSFIWAKYNMLPDNLTQSLGRLYDAVEEIYLPDKNGKSLFNYTHDKSSVYSRSIAEKNLTVKDGNIQRSVTETLRDAYNAWYNTAYQGKNYYDILNNHQHSFGGSTNITYNDTNSTTNSIIGYTFIDYENEINSEFGALTAATQYSKDSLESLKRPKRNAYTGDTAAEDFKNDLDEWKTKKGKKRRQEKRDAKDEYRENLEIQNSYIKGPKTLLTKTSKLFKENKIDSLVSRLYGNDSNKEFIDTSKTKYGKSRGRNLLKSKTDYNNPFCRTWAAHHQYGSKYSLIRPFSVSGKTLEESELLKKFRAPQGGAYLHDHSVLKNGFVKITPSSGSTNTYDTKRCMFSIENLAWKDVNHEHHLSQEQRGPNGGRIMWFPPYDLHFQESSQAQWNETNFIGRGEPIYTYTNTKRTGSLSFTLLIDHPSIMNVFAERAEKDNVDEDNDILRFFAGCDFPMTLGDSSEKNNIEGEGSSVYETNSGEGEELVVNVYFPYGYSGSESNNWDDYLFSGVNTYYPNFQGLLFNSAIGYEISNKGITDTDVNWGMIGSNNYSICENNKYYYLIDAGFNCKKNPDENELKDKKSYLLNNSTNSENEISFAELYVLCSKLNNKFNKTIESFAKSINVLRNDGKFYNKKAQSILDNKGLGKFKVDLVYNKVPNESTQLGNKRSSNVKMLIEELGTLIEGSTREYIDDKLFNKKGEAKSIYKNKNINSKQSKEWRKVTATIRYNIPENELTTPTISNGVTGADDSGVTATTDEILNGLLRASGDTQYPNYNEGDYFAKLENIDNIAYQKIKEKIKYFEPAYHSISPEGFNSRLTFLHQCTRQGHTLERKAGDNVNDIGVAGNMAFGRPPFCILRIGDFINTKILIRSLNIVYQNGSGMQWDMNPEGIGVQPMFAKITLQIEIIGGQSLDAPVSRLNNAVSFNYYANASVYDNRADRAIYSENEIKYNSLYKPQTKN